MVRGQFCCCVWKLVGPALRRLKPVATMAKREVDQLQDAVIDVVEKAVFALHPFEDDNGAGGAAVDDEDDLANHPLLNDGLVLIKCKAKGTRLAEERRFVWVDATGLHWVAQRGKPQGINRGKALALHAIERVTADADGAEGSDPLVFTVIGA